MTTDHDPSRHADTSHLFGRRSKSAIRFAPNFSVYVLPPDGVCLYAENRKVFLRGELYCALASRIRAGERPDAVVGALSGKFPAAKIDEAITRLLDQGFLVLRESLDDVAAGYWTSLSLAAATALENLANTGVRIESIGGGGENELAAALHGFGVRVVDGLAGLTVVLVEDYLDSRLAEFNHARLAARQPWLLVQPSDLVPLIGPVFSPGKSACWACLADRMKWNRQIKAYLDRHDARCVVASPLNTSVLVPTAIGLAAAEIAQAVASGFRASLHHDLHHDLHRNVISLDLLGSTVARHDAQARPQCPACGSRELRDPARSPAPPRLRAGGRNVPTGGGYRSVAPAETFARYRRHVSALTGIVSQLERVGSALPLDCSFHARHSFSPRPYVVDAPRVSLLADSYGKGTTAEQGEASALMKAIERHCGIFRGDEIRTKGRFADFPRGDAIPPNDILLFSPAHHANVPSGATLHGTGAPPGFDAAAETEWSPVWSLRDERFKYVPTGLLYFFHDGAGDAAFAPDSNGCAAGNTLEEAVVQGFLELVERDACAIWWYNRLRRGEIDIDRLGDGYVSDMRARYAAMGRSLWVLDVTSDFGIPVVVAVLHWKDDSRERTVFAAGAHFDLRTATLQAATELNQILAVGETTRRSALPPGDDAGDALPLRRNAYQLPDGKAPIRRAMAARFSALDRREQVLACVKLARRRGFDVLVLDQTRPDLGVPVVRVIVPGLRPFRRRFGPGRLYDVPVEMGLRQRPLRESALNPRDPPTR